MRCFLVLLFILVIFTSSAGAAANLIDGVVEFDSGTNLSVLLNSVNNASQLSETGGIYTMHVPFYQNSSSDGFTIDTTLHLNSTAGAIAYYRWANTTITGATILGWNTTSDVAAPKTDAARAYMYSDSGAVGDITNSNISYLGYDNNATSYGMHLYYSNATVSGNTMLDCYWGIAIASGGGNMVNDNIITTPLGNGVYVTGGTSDTIDNNTITSPGGYGVILDIETSTTVSNTTVTNGDSYGVLLSECNGVTFSDNMVSGSSAAGVGTFSITSCEFSNNEVYDNGASGYEIKFSSTGNTFTNETIYNNGGHGLLISSNGNTAISCNISDSNGIYTDYYLDSGTSIDIIDNVNRSNQIKTDVTFDILYTGAEYNTTYTATSCTIKDNTLTSGQFYNTTVLAGTVGQVDISGVPASSKFILFHSNGTQITTLTSSAVGVLTITGDLTSGSYYVLQGYDNFVWSAMSLTPSAITTAESSVIACTVTDSDGTILVSYAYVNGANKSMTSLGSGKWSYSFTTGTAGTYPVIFYAQDNSGYWNTTNPALSIVVTTPVTPPDGGGGLPQPPDVCDGIVCTSYCEGTTYYYQGTCVDGVCTFQYQENHINCIDDLCEGVTCSPHCEGTTYHFNGTCTDGTCTFETAEDHPNCPESVVDTWDMLTNLFFMLLALILIVVVYNEVLSK